MIIINKSGVMNFPSSDLINFCTLWMQRNIMLRKISTTFLQGKINSYSVISLISLWASFMYEAWIYFPEPSVFNSLIKTCSKCHKSCHLTTLQNKEELLESGVKIFKNTDAQKCWVRTLFSSKDVGRNNFGIKSWPIVIWKGRNFLFNSSLSEH